MKEFWNSRYAALDYAYGKAPNVFFKNTLDQLNTTGRFLFPAEGEGRNAVHAAKKGCSVEAFDISEAGQAKALALANEHSVTINYSVGALENLPYEANTFDAIVLIYAHFPPHLIANYHQTFVKLLKPNGLIIFEAFSKNHLAMREKNPAVGGPDKLEMLFSTDSIQTDFDGFDIIHLEEVEIELNEGLFHNGVGKVIQFIGRKM